MNTRMADLSLNDSQPQIPIYLSPPTSFSESFSSDPQINPNPSTSPYNNNFLSRPTETPQYGNNLNRPPPPASLSSSNFRPSSSSDPDFNTCDYNQVSFELDVDDSFDPATESNRRRGFLDPDVPRETREENNSRVRTSADDPDPNGMDEEPSLDETDEQSPSAAESTQAVDSLGNLKSLYRFVSPTSCSWRYDSFDLAKKAKKSWLSKLKLPVSKRKSWWLIGGTSSWSY